MISSENEIRCAKGWRWGFAGQSVKIENPRRMHVDRVKLRRNFQPCEGKRPQRVSWHIKKLAILKTNQTPEHSSRVGAQ